MKPFFLFMTFCLAGNTIFCQCTDPGLKIESQGCENPKSLAIRTITCSELSVRWSGTKNQTYIIQGVYTDASTLNQTKAKISQASCDNEGNCSATIYAKERSLVNWTVQAVCTIGNAIFYSAEIAGPEATAKSCPTPNRETGS